MPHTHVSAAGVAVPSTISRRAILGALAAAPVAAFPAVSNAGSAGSEIAEMIADFRMKEEEQTALMHQWIETHEKYAYHLPVVEVAYEARSERDGVPYTYPVIFRKEQQIKTFFQTWPHAAHELKAARRKKCRRLVAQLRRVKATHDQMLVDLGITHALNLYERCGQDCRRRHLAIFAYRPKSLAEMDEKNAFLAEWFEQGCALSLQDARLVFGSTA